MISTSSRSRIRIGRRSSICRRSSSIKKQRSHGAGALPEPFARRCHVLTSPLTSILPAARAGLPKVQLVEEPQAACYDWLARHRAQLDTTLGHVRLLLVCDVGGGTTDLTLIRVVAEKEGPRLVRIGVGDHLMLGGDNMDLALAHLAESRLMVSGERLSAAGNVRKKCSLEKG